MSRDRAPNSERTGFEPPSSRRLARFDAERVDYPDATTLLKLSSPPSHTLVDPLRNMAIAVVQARYTQNVAQYIGVATNELVENAALYGTLSTDFEYVLLVAPQEKHLVIRASNAAMPLRIAKLRAHIEKLRAGGAKQVLEDGLRSACRGDGHSQLGLARVVCEGRMELALEAVGSRVTVSALYRV